jgi:dTDP-4-dehydrorhamnose reductase
MRITVLGADGQLGRDLLPKLNAHALRRADCDLARSETVAPAVARAAADVLVNCAAYNFVDRAQTESEIALDVNALGVWALARECANRGTKLVHFSTDYVFGRDPRTVPYRETDAPGPLGAYGVSKLAGEHFVLSASDRHLVIRTCGLYGAHGVGGKGGNFVETMLRLAREGKPIRVVDDQRCTPTYTVDLADATKALIERGATGLVHVTSGGDCTWYEFAQEIFRLAGLKPDLKPISSAEFGAPARRPAYSVLSNAKLHSLGVKPLRHWKDALAAYLKERAARS